MLLFRAFLPPAPPFPAFFPSFFLFMRPIFFICVSYRSGKRLEIIFANNPVAAFSSSRPFSPCRAPLTAKLFIYVLLGNSATNKLTVEKIFLYTNVIYNIHIYNLSVDAHTRASSKVTAGTRVYARTRARV